MINKINIYRYNIHYIKDTASFDIIHQVQNTNIEASKHRKVMQLVFNVILESTNVIQEYFDKDIINFETMELTQFFDKVVKMSSNFSSINKYIAFYIELNKVNNMDNNFGINFLK